MGYSVFGSTPTRNSLAGPGRTHAARKVAAALLQEEWQCVEMTVAAALCAVAVQRQLEGRLVRWPGAMRGMPASRAGLIIVRGLSHASEVGWTDAQSSLKTVSSLELPASQLALKKVSRGWLCVAQMSSSGTELTGNFPLDPDMSASNA